MAVEIQLHERSALPPSRTGAIKPPTQLADQSGQIALGQAAAKFGGDTFNRLEQTRVANEEAQFQGFVKSAMGEYDVFVAANPGASFDDLNKEREKMLKGIKAAGNSATMPGAKQTNARWYDANLGSIRFQTQASMESIRAKQELATYNQLQENNIKSLSIDGKAKYTDNMEKAISNGLVEETSARAKQVEDFAIFDAAQEKVNQTKIKEAVTGEFQAVIDNGGTKQEAYAVVDAAEESGLIQPTLKGTLKNNVDSYVAGRKQKSEAAVKRSTQESYEDLMPLMFDPTAAQDRFNAVDTSKMLKAEKEKWNSYIKGSYKEAPKVTTAKGQIALNDATFAAMELTASPTEAYDSLLTQRFIKGSITDKDFEWALGKIKDPYKRDTLENLKFAINSNKAAVRKGFNTPAEEQRLVDSNASLVQWVDDQLEAGKTPTKKEMNAMASQFRVTDGPLVGIGQIINRGGVQWEVVGFDTDGEPLVEESEESSTFRGGSGGSFGTGGSGGGF